MDNSRENRLVVQYDDHSKFMSTVFCSMLERKSLLDITIQCEDQTLHAHKVILAANSPYIREKLEEHPSTEEIIFNGMNYATIKCILEFIYCGETTIIEENLKYIVAAGKLLQIRGLQALESNTSGDDAILYPPPTFIYQPPKFFEDESLVYQPYSPVEVETFIENGNFGCGPYYGNPLPPENNFSDAVSYYNGGMHNNMKMSCEYDTCGAQGNHVYLQSNSCNTCEMPGADQGMDEYDMIDTHEEIMSASPDDLHELEAYPEYYAGEDANLYFTEEPNSFHSSQHFNYDGTLLQLNGTPDGADHHRLYYYDGTNQINGFYNDFEPNYVPNEEYYQQNVDNFAGTNEETGFNPESDSKDIIVTGNLGNIEHLGEESQEKLWKVIDTMIKAPKTTGSVSEEN